MKRFNLSEWAITHQSLVLFMIILLGAAGIYSYRNLGRAEDQSHHQDHGRAGRRAGRDRHGDGDRPPTRSRKAADVAYLDRIEAIRSLAFHSSASFRRQDAALAGERALVPGSQEGGRYRGDLAAGHHRPGFNDEYGDVYSALVSPPTA
jgi:hypothetical protein